MVISLGLQSGSELLAVVREQQLLQQERRSRSQFRNKICASPAKRVFSRNAEVERLTTTNTNINLIAG